jgi:outer membrane protein
MKTRRNQARMKTGIAVIIMLFAGLALAQAEESQEMMLSLEQAKDMALRNNPEIKAAGYDLEVAGNDIIRAKASYDPYLQIDSSYSKSKRPTSQTVFGRESESASVNLSSGVSTPTGGSVSLDLRNTRQESDSMFMTLNPSYNTDLSLSMRQPLLKNSYVNLRKMDLTQKENDLSRTELSLKSKTMEVISAVEDAYWSLVKARMDLDSRRQSMALAERLHEVTRAQVDQGVLAPVALVQSEASLASARASIIRSEGDYQRAQNNLKMLLYFKSEDDLLRLEIIPTDEASYEEVGLNAQGSMELALANNFALKQMELNLDNLEISNKQTKNRLLPQLDLSASISVSGLAGKSSTDPQIVQTGFVIPNPYPTSQPYIIETTAITSGESEYEGGYNEALESMFEQDNTSYTASVILNVPLGNRAARSDWRSARYNLEKMELEMSRQKRNIIFAMESLINDVEVAHRSFEAARLARELEAQSLATEENKFRLGMNTHYQVMEAEERFTDARSAEISALIEYNKALGRMRRAEQGYLQTGGISVSIPSVSLAGMVPSGISGLSTGISSASLQSLMSQLPAGVDLSALKAMGINIP